jgi:cytidine deaminase
MATRARTSTPAKKAANPARRRARPAGTTAPARGKAALGPTDRTLRRLLVAAVAARKRAHAPYSGFPVGAALLGDDRRVYAGCNVENSSFGLTLCAERNAVGQAVARGVKRIRAIAIVAGAEQPVPPCGMCLQTLTEFADGDLPILLAGVDGREEVTTLGALFPRRFDQSFLAGPKTKGRRP